eukprot:comp19808_c0_seq2/m.23792 comp19808_c0_seq2/g.23792  ORF comp19808_c0_seq2/g.23792 comp19808_c0_seq2/m.23792 type:complete len:218 (-) comp19808_c0_seq2:483-1136(-)
MFSPFQVLPQVYLGSVRDSRDRQQLNEFGVTHILSVHEGSVPLYEDMQYKCISAADSPNQNLSQYFKECNDFIHQARAGGGTVLVHCIAGVSRSTTIVVAYMMAVTSLGWDQALTTVQASRSVASPNSGFRTQLIEYGKGEAQSENARLRQQYPCIQFEDEPYLLDIIQRFGELRRERFMHIQRDLEAKKTGEWRVDVEPEGEEEKEVEAEAIEQPA